MTDNLLLLIAAYLYRLNNPDKIAVTHDDVIAGVMADLAEVKTLKNNADMSAFVTQKFIDPAELK